MGILYKVRRASHDLSLQFFPVAMHLGHWLKVKHTYNQQNISSERNHQLKTVIDTEQQLNMLNYLTNLIHKTVHNKLLITITETLY